MNKISILDEYKCVVFKDDLIIYQSKESGIKPIINLIDNKINADKYLRKNFLLNGLSNIFVSV